MINNEKEYAVLNPNGSVAIVITKDGEYIIPSGTDDEPGVMPFSLNEIQQINANSQMFKTGQLMFEPEDAEEIYGVLKIRDYQSILTNAQIDDIILHPTKDGLKKILDIKNNMYFERVFGRYVSLQNLGLPISSQVIDILKVRKNEIRIGRLTTEIIINDNVSAPVNNSAETEELKKQNASLMDEIAQMKEMMAQLMATQKTGTTQQTAKPKKAAPKKSTSASKK